MLRAGVSLFAAGFCHSACAGRECISAPQDTSNLIQKHKSVADFEFSDDDDGSEWSFKTSVFDKLLDNLKPDSVEERIDQIIGDNGISLEAAQRKLQGLALKFGSRLNRTIDAAQERLAALQDFMATKGRQVKDQSLLQAVTMITQLGDSAVDVAEKVTATVESGQLKVKQFVRMLESERVEGRHLATQRSLEAAGDTLAGLLQSLEEAMGLDDKDLLLLEGTESDKALASGEDATEAALQRAKQLLARTDAVLGTARVYVDFVSSRVGSVRDEASRLVKNAGNQTDAAFDAGDALAADIIRKLGDIDGMLSGGISQLDAVEIMKRERSLASLPGLSFSVLASMVASMVQLQ